MKFTIVDLICDWV